MDLAQMVVKAGDYAFRRGSSATPDASMTVAEQQRRRGLNKRVMRADIAALPCGCAGRRRTGRCSGCGVLGGGQDAGACRLRAWGES